MKTNKRLLVNGIYVCDIDNKLKLEMEEKDYISICGDFTELAINDKKIIENGPKVSLIDEQQYINVTELVNLRNALNILHDITLDNSIVIDKDKMQEIKKDISIWIDKLYDAITVEG